MEKQKAGRRGGICREVFVVVLGWVFVCFCFAVLNREIREGLTRKTSHWSLAIIPHS